MRRFLSTLPVVCSLAGTARAADQLASVGTFSYLLTTGGGGAPAYAVILMPGGRGILEPRQNVNGKIVFQMGGNFLIRSRALFASGPFVAASTDATTDPSRILAIVADLQKRYGALKVYVVGTSRSTDSTMALAGPLDGKVAGFVHSSSMSAIASFDTRRFRSRHLIVLHKHDACRVTRPSAGASAHSTFGTELIEMDGGKSTGEDCEAFAYHGYNSIERETVDRIKAWIAAK
jgi:hypothetical protein